MTVGIATLCNESKNVIVAADRMITASYPPIEFEHGTSKLDVVCPSCVILTSGDVLAQADVCRTVRVRVGALSRPRINAITEDVKTAYAAQRLKTISERFLEPRGWSLKDFYEKHVRTMPADIVVTIDHQISTYDYGLSIIVAGIDPGEAHIYGIRHPGEVDCYDSLGYHAIGIGSMHAISSLIANSYLSTVSTKMAVYLAYEAKRNAENAPGVGLGTDIALIGENGCQIITSEEISLLEKIYDSRRIHQTEEFREAVENLPF